VALPFLLSALGSAAAGASLLGTMSPLIAGALGAGIGSWAETGDITKGIRTGLTSGLMGAAGGALVGGGASAAGTGALTAGQQTALEGAKMAAAQQAANAPASGIMGMFRNMQPGTTAVTDGPLAGGLSAIGQGPGQVPLMQAAQAGFRNGTMTGAGIGTALGGAMMSQPPMPEIPGQNSVDRPQAAPANRAFTPAPAGYDAGYQPEWQFFDPSPTPSTYSGGGRVQYRPTGMQPVTMAAGGIADAGMNQELTTEPNDKDVVQGAIAAVEGRLPEEQAALMMGEFLNRFGEDALRRLVDDVQTGKAAGERGDVEGPVRGPGDGMDDLVPARMDDGSNDVLLSDGEFVIPADVVSGIGNGSSDAGAQQLDEMMSRVRTARTGRPAQPKQVNTGGLLPA